MSIQKADSVQHQGWVDVVRVLGAFLVVLAHTGMWGNQTKWAFPLFYAVSRNGVPIFFMVSGFLLLSKQEDLFSFLKKRARRIFIPFLFWSLVYDLYAHQEILTNPITLEVVARIVLRIARGPRAGHLWFFYTLIGLYLFTPILRLFVTKAQKADFLYYIGLWLFSIPVLKILESFTPIRLGLELPMFSGYIGYYLLGYYLGRMESSRKQAILAFILFMLAAGFTFIVMLFDLPPQDETVFRSYLSLNVIVMSGAAFFLLKHLAQSQSSHWWTSLSQTTLGIYLIHPLVIEWLAQGPFLTIKAKGPALIWIPLVAFLVFSLSSSLVWILQKIPGLNATVG